jgi:O-acetyl-ADP-ribose deacetylase
MAELEVVLGDITRLRVDAIVNAANERMLGGGGVDGAIHAAAGPQLLAACKQVPESSPGVRCPTGQVRLTPGFELPAKFVIHTVGPIWHGGGHGEPALLAACYREAIQLAEREGIRSLAFPSISCGVYGYPHAQAAQLAVSAVASALASAPNVERVLFVAFNAAMQTLLTDALTVVSR